MVEILFVNVREEFNALEKGGSTKTLKIFFKYPILNFKDEYDEIAFVPKSGCTNTLKHLKMAGVRTQAMVRT